MYLATNEIKKREGQSVRAFITRYTDETAQITRLNEDQRIAGFVHRVNIKSLVKFISTELPEGYNEHMEKEYSWLQAEETASKGRPVTFIDGSWKTSRESPSGRRSSLRHNTQALLLKALKRDQRKKKGCVHNIVLMLWRESHPIRRD
ncbi:hypothetical protein Tco_0271721 [Tanacetum coccineum]